MLYGVSRKNHGIRVTLSASSTYFIVTSVATPHPHDLYMAVSMTNLFTKSSMLSTKMDGNTSASRCFWFYISLAMCLIASTRHSGQYSHHAACGWVAWNSVNITFMLTRFRQEERSSLNRIEAEGQVCLRHYHRFSTHHLLVTLALAFHRAHELHH